MPPIGRIGASPKRIAYEHPTRRMWKQFLNRSWRNWLPQSTTQGSSKNTRGIDLLALPGRPLSTQMNMASERGLTKAHYRCPNHVGYATGNTSAQSRSSLVSSVVGSHPIPIISGSHKAGLYQAERATNSPSRCAAVTIGKFIAAATKPNGGDVKGSMRSGWHAHFGSSSHPLTKHPCFSPSLNITGDAGDGSTIATTNVQR